MGHTEGIGSMFCFHIDVSLSLPKNQFNFKILKKSWVSEGPKGLRSTMAWLSSTKLPPGAQRPTYLRREGPGPLGKPRLNPMSGSLTNLICKVPLPYEEICPQSKDGDIFGAIFKPATMLMSLSGSGAKDACGGL